jgi:O-antigen/teichoic acid export membrane protein
LSIRRGVAISFGRTGASFLISFVSNVVLARLLLPSEIGLFSTALAVLAILHAIRDFGLGRYLLKEPVLTDDKIRTVFGMAILISWSLGLAIYLLRHGAAAFYREPQIGEVLALLSVNFFFLPFGQPALALMRRERRYGRLSMIAVASSLAGAVVSVVSALLGYGPLALTHGAIANTGTTVVLCLASRPDHLLMLPSLKSWRDVFHFGSLGSGTTLINQMGAQAPELFLGRLLGFSAVGLYSRALGISTIIQRLFAQAVAWVMGAEFAAVFRSGKAPAASVLSVTDYLVVVGWPALVFLAFKADTIILYLYGENWLPAAPLVPALCLYQAIHLLVSQAGALYEGSGNVKLQLRNAMTLQVISIALLVVGSMHSLLAVAWLRALHGVAEVVVQISVYRRHVDIGLRNLLAACLRSMIVTGGVAAVLAVLIMLEPVYADGALSALVVQAILVGLSYVALLHAVGHPLVNQLRFAAGRAISAGLRGKKA